MYLSTTNPQTPLRPNVSDASLQPIQPKIKEVTPQSENKEEQKSGETKKCFKCCIIPVLLAFVAGYMLRGGNRSN